MANVTKFRSAMTVEELDAARFFNSRNGRDPYVTELRDLVDYGKLQKQAGRHMGQADANSRHANRHHDMGQ